jgi:hypothetical protein
MAKHKQTRLCELKTNADVPLVSLVYICFNGMQNVRKDEQIPNSPPFTTKEIQRRR